MTMLGIPAGTTRFTSFVLMAMTGLLSQSQPVIAQEPAAGSREKVIAALNAARMEYLNEVSIEDEKRVLSVLYLAEQSQRSLEQALAAAKALEAKGIVTALQVDAVVVAAENAKQQLEKAQAKLKSLRESKAKVLELFDQLLGALYEMKSK